MVYSAPVFCLIVTAFSWPLLLHLTMLLADKDPIATFILRSTFVCGEARHVPSIFVKPLYYFDCA